MLVTWNLLIAILSLWILGAYKGTGHACTALRDDLTGLSTSRQNETTRDQATARACPTSLSEPRREHRSSLGREVGVWRVKRLEWLRDGTNFLGKSIDTGSSGMICWRVLFFCQKPETDKSDIS